MEFGIAGSNITQTSNIGDLNVRQYIAIRLEEGTTYEFAVRGIYEEGVDGLDSVVTGRTRDDSELVGLVASIVRGWTHPGVVWLPPLFLWYGTLQVQSTAVSTTVYGRMWQL